ncbi:SpaA isopeptide-forming pilin-related protein [Ruminococcus sp. YH-rum2234]|uniref:SpaA isopeptide-forming pilin-related protein n=2 Tax=Fusibacillus kribbianus TaxID=3044208 RepID=A0AAP4BA51_9FIRM|nr:SpaA isopeptide-forming pilin-related protein [Ruminococcus sp. YH-rum2234]
MTCGYYDPVYAALNISVTPATTSVQFSKQDLTTGAELPGATLKVTDSSGKIIDEWVSGSTPHSINGLIVDEKYTLTETIPAPGYVTAQSITFTAAKNAQPVVMKDDITRIEISKKDLATGEELPGATLTVTDENGNKVDEWVSGTTPHRIEKLTVGKTYTLTETIPAAGYSSASSIKFTVANTGTVQKIEMKDDITRIEISKTDLTTGEELPGATLTVTDEDGNKVDEWVSEETPHSITNLVVGKKYTLTETIPADGYSTAESIEFTIADTSEIQKIEMKDDITRIEISKTDLTTGERLPGATLTVTDEDGNKVDEWVSEETPHSITNLVVGKKYTLTETIPADGYSTAESIEFTIADTSEIQKIEMKDDITRIEISKTDLTTGEELPGATLTVTDEDGNKVDEWVSEETPHSITNLVVGKKYTLTETIPADGYSTAESIEFTIDDTSEIQKIEMKDDTTKVEVSKLDVSDKKQIPGATLQIIDKDGVVVREWISENDPKMIEKLIAGETYVLHEKEAPEGYLTASDVEFTVADTGEVQTVAIEDELAVIKLEVGKETIRRTQAGDTYKYTITDITNASNTELENFTCTDFLPSQVIMKELHTGTFSHDLTYTVAYRTNASEEWHVLAADLDSGKDQVLSFTNLSLASGEQVTAFRYEFGTVPEGFKIGEVKPVYFVTVKEGTKASEELVNNIKLTGDWRGTTTEDNDKTVTLLFSNSISSVFTGDAAPIIYLVLSMIVSAGVVAWMLIRRRRQV